MYLRSFNWTSSPISGTTWTHTYAAEGTYDVNVTCYNNVSIQSVVVPQYIQAPIVNLRLRHNGALVVSTGTVLLPFSKMAIFLLPAALRGAQTCRYLIYSEADFEVFLPRRGDTLLRWG